MVGMSILDAAREAWLEARSGRESEARAALAKVLSPFDVSKLATVDMEAGDTYTLFVFNDPNDDIHLAARSNNTGWDVHVVEADGDKWTHKGKPVESLAHLYELVGVRT